MHIQRYQKTCMFNRKPLITIICQIIRRGILNVNSTYYNNSHSGFYGNRQTQKYCCACPTAMPKRKLQPERYNIEKKRVLETVPAGGSTITGDYILGKCISSLTESVQHNCSCLEQASCEPARDRWKVVQPDLVFPKPGITRGVSLKSQNNMNEGEEAIEVEGNQIACVQGDTLNHRENCDVGTGSNDNNIDATQLIQYGKNMEVLYCQPNEVAPLDHSHWSDTTPPDHQCGQSDTTPSDQQFEQSAQSDTTPPDHQCGQSDTTPPDHQCGQSAQSDTALSDPQAQQPDQSDTTPPHHQFRHSSQSDVTQPHCQQSVRSDTTSPPTKADMASSSKTKPTVLPEHVLEKVEQFVSMKCDSDISWIRDVMLPSETSNSDSEAEDAYLFGNLFSEQQENVKMREQTVQEKESSAVGSLEESGEVTKGKGHCQKPRKPSPNYFVAVQITNPQIHSRLSHVQQEVMSVNHKMKEVMIKLPTLHITLMVMNLQTEEDIARAREALTESGCELRDRFKTLPVLEVAGLGTFRNQVVFATVSPGDALDDLTHIHQCVIDKMADHGVVSTETKGLTPHITIMKMSKVKASFRRSVAKKIDPSMYSKFKDMVFGTEMVQRLQLCAMLKPKDTSGYYHVAHEVYLGQGEVTVSEFSRSLVQSSIVSALETVKMDSVTSSAQVNSQNSKGKPDHKPQKKKQKSKKSKEVKK
ncbi:uncharacterized protein [Haliotis asinina]|uniref:uncharacterized protein n=1 Tax=Haliotis asinina TaxID=109174 RepID=UPI00353240F7